MAGHSKWANRVHRKTRQDAKRSSIFSKLSREIIVAAREGGGNPDTNLRLRYAIDAAREASMPNENVDNAIRRGTGEVEGVTYENVVYEGYGPGGTALMISCLTDNSQRTLRTAQYPEEEGQQSRRTGFRELGIEQKGVIIVPKAGIEEEELFMAAIDAGAEDMLTEDE